MDVYSEQDWFKAGGRELQFFALDEEVDRWLAEGLPKEYWPYELLTFDLVQVERRKYRERRMRCEDLSVSRYRQEGRDSLWLISRRLSPRLLASVNTSAECSLSGLISIQPGVGLRSGLQSSRISIVSRVWHKTTGEISEHGDYLKIFRTLSRRIKKDLTHATVLGEGEKAIVLRNPAMTTAAREAALAGRVQFQYRPGPPLRA